MNEAKNGKNIMLDLKKLIPLTKVLNTLYVEDNEEVRGQTQKLLSRFFENLDIAVNGEDGLNKYKEYFTKNQINYDLIITDINMPIMDGLEMSKSILNINKEQHIIVVSAYNDAKNLQKCIDTGIKNYLHKPIELDNLINAFTKVTKSIQEKKGSKKHINDIEEINREFDVVINNYDQYVIASRTDLKGKITYTSRAYEAISGYSKEELIGNSHNLVKHPDMPKDLFKKLWGTIKNEQLWSGEIKNLRKDGTHYWVKAEIAPYYDPDGNHIGYSAIRSDITSQKEAEELHNQISDLLNNAGQGYLSFGENLKCESAFSRECLNIFNIDNIEGLDITKLLFNNETSKIDIFLKAIYNILNNDNTKTKELFLSLLPKEQIISQKIVNIEYKLLQNNCFMIILTDISEKKELEKELNLQNQIQKMIIAVSSNRDDFLELKSEFEDFISNTPKDKPELLRALHTFKGVFFQKEMLNIANSIHTFESGIKEHNTINSDGFDILSKNFNKDLNLIKENLQEKFLINSNTFKINNKSIIDIEKKIKAISTTDKDISNKLDEVLFDIDTLRHKPIKNLLNIYPKHVKQMAKKLDKYIHPLRVIGDKKIVASAKIRPFIKSLVHLFNNCIEHGIENIDKRVELGKDQIGTIKCHFKNINNILILEVSDDGSGIDIDKLVNSVIKKGILTKNQCDNLTLNEKLKLVFIGGISTKKKASITSGRGIGMSVINECIHNIGGKIIIENSIGKGVTFRFLIPLEKYTPNLVEYSGEEVMFNSLVNQTKLLFQNECNIEILEENSIDTIDNSVLTECNSKIDFQSKYNGSFILCYPKRIKNDLESVFIPDGFSDDEINEMRKELSGEIINTIVGNAIVDFPKQVGSVSISVPTKITKKDHKLIIENKDIRLIKKLDTKCGKILCIILNNEGCHSKTQDIQTVEEMALI